MMTGIKELRVIGVGYKIIFRGILRTGIQTNVRISSNMGAVKSLDPSWKETS